MTVFKTVSLIDTLKNSGESAVCEALSSFSSPLNKDVEKFLKNSAVEFAKQNIAPTTLVYYRGEHIWSLCGYFTLTIKTIEIERKNLTSTMFKRAKKFGTYNNATEKCTVSVPLIAQLGKNFTCGYNKLIQGAELLRLACDKVKAAQEIIGGKIVYLECEDVPKLISFYNNNGFTKFSQRPLDHDQQSESANRYLIQMLKYLD